MSEIKDSTYIGTFLLSALASAIVVGRGVYQLQKELVEREGEMDEWED